MNQQMKERPPLVGQLPQFRSLFYRKDLLVKEIQDLTKKLKETKKSVEEGAEQLKNQTQNSIADVGYTPLSSLVFTFNREESVNVWLRFAINRAIACVHMASTTRCRGYQHLLLDIISESIDNASEMDNDGIMEHYICTLEHYIGYVSYLTGMELPRITREQYEQRYMTKSAAHVSDKLRHNCYIELFLEDPKIWRDISTLNQREFLQSTSKVLKLNFDLIKREKWAEFEWRQPMFQRMITALTRFFLNCSNRKNLTSLVIRNEILLHVKSIVRRMTSYFNYKFFPSILGCCDFIYHVLCIGSTIENGPDRSSIIEPFILGLTIRSFLLLLQYNQTQLLNESTWHNSDESELCFRICVRLYSIFHTLCVIPEKPLKKVLDQTMIRHLGTDQQIALPLIVYNGLFVRDLEIKMLSMKLLGALTLDIDEFAVLWLHPDYQIHDLLLHICAGHILEMGILDDEGHTMVIDEEDLLLNCGLIQDAIFASVALMSKSVNLQGNESSFPRRCALFFSWVYMVSDKCGENHRFHQMAIEMRDFLSENMPVIGSQLKVLYPDVIDDSTQDSIKLLCDQLVRNTYTRDSLISNCQSYWKEFCEQNKDRFQAKQSMVRDFRASDSSTDQSNTSTTTSSTPTASPVRLDLKPRSSARESSDDIPSI